MNIRRFGFRIGQIALAASMLLTVGVVTHPQGSARAATRTLTTCNASEFISAWVAAIATPEEDYIQLKSGCQYLFTNAYGTGGDRALPVLPSIEAAGRLVIVGNGASLVKDPGAANSFGLLELTADALLHIVNTHIGGFDANLGGAIVVNSNATMLVSDSLFEGNRSILGGAIRANNGSNLTVYRSLFSVNSALDGAAIYTSGANQYIGHSSFIFNNANGDGGAISVYGGYAAFISVSFIGNAASGSGGAVRLSGGIFNVRNCTLYGNTADTDQNNQGNGGGLYLEGTFPEPVLLYNTVIAQNYDNSTSGAIYPDVAGNVNAVNSNNFIGIGAGLTGISDGVNANRIGTFAAPLDPRLGLLTFKERKEGSALAYVAPLANSPLINTGSNAAAEMGQDGRLHRRLIYQTIDIGAIEFKRPDSPVVINPTNQAWLHRYTNSAGPVDLSYLYGQGLSDYQPVKGDWDGDDIDTQGIYTRFNANNIGVFALSNTFNSFNSSTLPAFVYTDANAGWQPLSGDWDYEGADSVGVYNTNTGVWVLTNENASVTPTYPAFTFGGTGKAALAGDWDGDGGDSIGYYDTASSTFVLSNLFGDDIGADYTVVYGVPGSTPVAGDWDGDGIDTPGLYNPTTGQWLLRNSNTTGAADIAFVYGQGSGLIGRAGQWKTVLPGDGTSPIRELAATPVSPVSTPDAPQIAPTFAP